jgi:hypothetical protein
LARLLTSLAPVQLADSGSSEVCERPAVGAASDMSDGST